LHFHDPRRPAACVYNLLHRIEAVDSGHRSGHINLAAGFGPWRAGERLLAGLVERVVGEQRMVRSTD
jgi:hypothetical protein